MRKSMQESNENAKIRKSAQNANSDFKYKRILQLYTRLLKGEVINKAKEAAAANVTERSIPVSYTHPIPLIYCIVLIKLIHRLTN